MASRIAINGFGRIGRLALRLIVKNYYNELEVVATNDLTNKENLLYLLKYDTTYGKFDGQLIQTEKGFKYGPKGVAEKDLKEIVVLSERDPRNLPWKEMKVDITLESTGFFANKAGAQLHLDAGAKKCIITAPGGMDVKTVVYNVNHDALNKNDNIISAASCTTNSIAPLVAAMHKEFGIEVGKMTTVHAFTGNQRLVDAPSPKDYRKGRAAPSNIIPSTTGAAKAIGLVIPDLAGKLDGSALRVPTLVGSISDLSLKLIKEPQSVEEINNAIAKYETESFKMNHDLIVSSDIIGSSYGAIFDATLTKINKNPETGAQIVTVCAWYDNETSFANQLLRLVHHVATLK